MQTAKTYSFETVDFERHQGLRDKVERWLYICIYI